MAAASPAGMIDWPRDYALFRLLALASVLNQPLRDGEPVSYGVVAIGVALAVPTGLLIRAMLDRATARQVPTVTFLFAPVVAGFVGGGVGALAELQRSGAEPILAQVLAMACLAWMIAAAELLVFVLGAQLLSRTGRSPSLAILLGPVAPWIPVAVGVAVSTLVGAALMLLSG